MWNDPYERRLRSWAELRASCETLPADQALTKIQSWWRSAPWQPYYLHWDDRRDWPGPWQLLSDSRFCGIAKTLGMLYTVCLLERPDSTDATMIEIEQDNLVLLRWGKYIMNWDQAGVVNILSNTHKITRTLESEVLNKLIG